MRFAVDIGGTFTDLVCHDERTGQVLVAKGPTTPAALEEGVIRLVRDSVRVEDATLFLHASTVGLNTLLQRIGGRVGLLATEGFRDVLELRRGERDHMLSLRWRPPEPLVPRSRRLGIRGRIRGDGTVETPLDEAQVAEAVARFVEQDVDCIAVAFINAYANPEHELAAESIIRAAGYDGDVTLSHRVSGEYREFERTATTCVDAYVRPRVGRYLRGLEARLGEMGFAGDMLIGRSGGGAMPFALGRDRAHELLMSGPAGGAVGTAVLCEALGIAEGVAADVGGTSFDTTLVIDGQPQVKYEGEIAGLPLQCEWVDVHSIGAGGGSIGYVDEGGLLRAGPRSAGAVPGPACYGRGGQEATATDAACLLGMLGPSDLAGGLTLDVGAARSVLAPLGHRLGMDAEAAAVGVLRILCAAMADAIRTVTVEQGRDPRDAALVAYGGAGPLFATLLATELEMRTVVIPPLPGGFSAYGLLCQNVTCSAARTSIRPLTSTSIAESTQTLRDLADELRGAMHDTAAGTALECALDLRYAGQEHTLTVPVTLDGTRIASDADTIMRDFEERYVTVFGTALQGSAEIVAVRATIRAHLPRPALKGAAGAHAASALPETVDAYSFTRGERVAFRCVDRLTLRAGDRVQGPAILAEPTAMTYLDAGFAARVHDTDALIITDAGGGTDGGR